MSEKQAELNGSNKKLKLIQKKSRPVKSELTEYDKKTNRLIKVNPAAGFITVKQFPFI